MNDKNVEVKTIQDIAVGELIILQNKHVCRIESIEKNIVSGAYTVKGKSQFTKKVMQEEFTSKDINIVYKPIVCETTLFVQQGIIKNESRNQICSLNVLDFNKHPLIKKTLECIRTPFMKSYNMDNKELIKVVVETWGGHIWL